MIGKECIDEMEEEEGMRENVEEIKEREMNGEIELEKEIRERVEILKGLKI